jgi:hypothetical protein
VTTPGTRAARTALLWASGLAAQGVEAIDAGDLEDAEWRAALSGAFSDRARTELAADLGPPEPEPEEAASSPTPNSRAASF